MENPIVKKIVNYVDSYIKYLMCVFAVFAILGVLIPTRTLGISIGNYFGMHMAGRAIVVILFTVVYVISALKFRKYFGVVSVVAAIVGVIVAGVAGSFGVYGSYIHGGVKMIKWARVWMLIMALINSAAIAVKTFIFHDTEA